MTNHWRDIKNADVILINGANPAEAHPVGFQWFMKAKLDPKRGIGSGGGAKMIHVDPRFTRTSAVSDIHARIRTGTDVAFFGGLINYVLEKNLIHHEYVRNYTNASFLVKDGYDFHEGLFAGYDPQKRAYDVSMWAYETDAAATATLEKAQAGAVAKGEARPGAGIAIAKRDMQLEHPRSVFQLLRKHYAPYTPEMVTAVTGIPTEQFLEIAKIVGECGRPDKVMTMVYAVGLTQHTTGGQLIRSAALLQLLLGNMGRPGGGMNAERGHANIQGNTDHAISWEILPGYLRIPAPGQKNLDDYVAQSAPKKFDTNSWNFFGTNYRNFMVSLLKNWYGDAAKPENNFAFDFVPKPATNSSWITIYDQALKKKMQGVILSGMTATSIGPDSNQVMQALANLKWAVVAVERAGDPARGRGPSRPLGDGGGVPAGEEALPAAGRQVPRSVDGADHDLQGSPEARAGGNCEGDQRVRPDHGAAARYLRQVEGRRHHDRRRLDLHRLLPGGRESGQAAGGDPGSGKERPDRHGLLPGLGLELADEPAGDVQPGLRRPRRQALGSDAPRHRVGCGAEEVDGRRAGLPGDDGASQPEGVGAVHHEQRGSRPPVLGFDARRAVPGALRADGVADSESAP